MIIVDWASTGVQKGGINLVPPDLYLNVVCVGTVSSSRQVHSVKGEGEVVSGWTPDGPDTVHVLGVVGGVVRGTDASLVPL